jgi:hypothetical protein
VFHFCCHLHSPLAGLFERPSKGSAWTPRARIYLLGPPGGAASPSNASTHPRAEPDNERRFSFSRGFPDEPLNVVKSVLVTPSCDIGARNTSGNGQFFSRRRVHSTRTVLADRSSWPLTGTAADVGMQPVPVHFPLRQGLRSRLIVMIQKPFRDDVIRTPLKADGPALPGTQEEDTTSLKGSEGISCAERHGPLADHDGPGPGPGVEPWGIGGSSTVVRCEHHFDRRVGLREGGQLDEAELIEVAGEQEMTARVLDVEH